MFCVIIFCLVTFGLHWRQAGIGRYSISILMLNSPMLHVTHMIGLVFSALIKLTRAWSRWSISLIITDVYTYQQFFDGTILTFSSLDWSLLRVWPCNLLTNEPMVYECIQLRGASTTRLGMQMKLAVVHSGNWTRDNCFQIWPNQ